MVSDTVYEICLPVLQDPALPEDEKADRVEDVLRQEARLTGKALEDAVLGVLWRHRDTTQGPTSPPPLRATQYGDYGSDNVDWIVNDDASSNASFGDSAFGPYPSDWIQPSMVEMSTYDMLRSVLRDEKSDEELEQVLQLNGYDFSQTIMALADPQALSATEAQNRTYLVGKSMSPTSRPLTPSVQSKSGIP
ncbi:unnamed protein product [Aureobasidium vineae]|uniref:Uncharacterized protein n=1 Tax=Aureobasidium vineae TaxID=2773715 RepID=A0A9N8JWX2_9PEZI|nr:unnamed protein product [Aureobasidium vineae]